MIDLKEELTRYQPTVEIKEIDEILKEEEIQDIIDIMMEYIKKSNE